MQKWWTSRIGGAAVGFQLVYESIERRLRRATFSTSDRHIDRQKVIIRLVVYQRHETAARLRACRTVEARGCYRRKFAPRGRSATWERLQHKPVHSSYGFQRTGSDETRVLPRSSRTHECDIVNFCREPRVTRVYSRVVSCGTGNVE